MKVIGILLFLISSAFPAFAQQSGQSQEKQPSAKASQAADAQSKTTQDEVVKLGVTLVQVDAVVTDKKGRYVRDLKPEDFEIYEDGRKQQITNFSYIVTQPDSKPSDAQPKPADKANDRKAPLALPPVNLRPEQIRRTIALVVDDLSLSFESAYSVRRSLKKFVDEQMQPGDLVAIIRTGAGMGALQQFTADKRQLYAAIERVRWNPSGYGGISAFTPIEKTPEDEARKLLEAGQAAREGRALGKSGDSSRDQDNARRTQKGDGINQFREEIFSVGTLGALNFIVRGLRDLPGRKSVILFSDGLTFFNADGNDTRVLEAVRRLTDLANRASVVIYTIDARGLVVLGLTAADNLSGLSQTDIDQKLEDRRTSFLDSQQGLNYLAQQTGGFAIRNSNDLGKGVERILEDQKGYYLIGYIPDESTFTAQTGRRLFHKISVKVKSADFKVRSRTGFYGIADEEARPAPRSREQQLISALTSPFAAGDIPLRLTSLFGYEQKAGPYVVSLLHVDLNRVTFTDDEKDMKRAIVDFGAVTFRDNGQVVDEIWRRQTIRIPAKNFEQSLRGGLVYTISVPVKKAGAYQLRAVVRDDATAQVGSANQFIEVPDVKKGRLTLSGITLEGAQPAAATAAVKAPVENQEGAQVGKSAAEMNATPAIRKLTNGMLMAYGFIIYNAKTDKNNPLPQLEAQVRLIKEGQLIYEGQPRPVPFVSSTDLKRIVATGQMRLDGIAAGEYVLQIVVRDKVAKEKYDTASQWIDFEVVK